MTPSPRDALRLAVLSDLHAYDPAQLEAGRERPSFATVSDATGDTSLNPFYALNRLIDSQELKADLLLCPGDLGDKAAPSAIKYAWDKIQEIASWLDAPFVAATAGNHDVDSRHQYNDYDAKGVLQDLSPVFPCPKVHTGDPLLISDKYWARHFVIIRNDHYRLLILNSSAYHGGDPAEQEHGRVAARTLARLERELQSHEPSAINILLCHHHPHEHEDLQLGNHDTMKEGSRLISLLGSGKYGQWIIIHGHKHHPKLCYAQGSAMSPIVFAAGSFSAALYQELRTAARNQFYIIELPFQSPAQMGLVGSFRAWDWIAEKGWQPAGTQSGLPARGGFGCRLHPPALAKEVSDALNGRESAPWQQMTQAIPALHYLLPNDLVHLQQSLEDVHKLQILSDANGFPRQIGETT